MNALAKTFPIYNVTYFVLDILFYEDIEGNSFLTTLADKITSVASRSVTLLNTLSRIKGPKQTEKIINIFQLRYLP